MVLAPRPERGADGDGIAVCGSPPPSRGAGLSRAWPRSIMRSVGDGLECNHANPRSHRCAWPRRRRGRGGVLLRRLLQRGRHRGGPRRRQMGADPGPHRLDRAPRHGHAARQPRRCRPPCRPARGSSSSTAAPTATAGRASSWAKFSEGLRPDPPDLKEVVDKRTPAQLFWVIKNGINMTGMPGFALAGAKDDDLWQIVAFLKKLPTVSEADFKAWTAPPPQFRRLRPRRHRPPRHRRPLRRTRRQPRRLPPQRRRRQTSSRRRDMRTAGFHPPFSLGSSACRMGASATPGPRRCGNRVRRRGRTPSAPPGTPGCRGRRPLSPRSRTPR